jgi:hypothetical protein
VNWFAYHAKIVMDGLSKTCEKTYRLRQARSPGSAYPQDRERAAKGAQGQQIDGAAAVAAARGG